MMIIESNVKLIEQGENIVSHVACCARVCYKRETGNDEVTYNNLIKNKHWSMFRHASYYYVIPNKIAPLWIRDYVNAKIVGAQIIGIDIKNDMNKNIFVVINGNWGLDHQKLVNTILNFQVSEKEFINISEVAFNMRRITFKVTTQISTSRELNRVSPNNIAEQSTRYVYEDGTLCRPYWMSEEEANEFNNNHQAGMTTTGRNYINSCIQSFGTYKDLIEINGMLRQDARGVLPLDTATEVVYTYSIAEWCHIIELRADKRAHPNANIIANMIKKELNKLGYDI